MKKSYINLLQGAVLPITISVQTETSGWVILARAVIAIIVLIVLFLMAEGERSQKTSNSFRWILLLLTLLLPPYLFWWALVVLAILLVPNPFFWEWIGKIIWEPFWWIILFLIILATPFLRMWWWLFLPWMLGAQLKTIYLWWIDWDFSYAKKAKWVLLEIIPLQEILIPLKAMEDVFTAIWPIYDGANFREIWCDGELDNGPFWCSWEIVSIEGKIHYYIRFLQQHRTSIESALYGHYPDIEIHEVEDYVKLVPPTVPNEEWDMYGEDWYLYRPDAYPCKTYEKFFEPQGERISAEEKRMDPIISLLEAMSKLGPGEHYWVQFTTVPVADSDEPDWRKEGKKIITKLAKRPEKKEPTLGEDLGYVLGQIAGGPEKEGEKYSWRPYMKEEETGEREMVLSPGEREIITEMENKMKKPAFRTNIRGVYIAKRDTWKPANRVITRTYMGHFSTANLNHFRFHAKTRPRVHFFIRKRRVFLRARKMFRMSVLRFPSLFPKRMSDDICPILSSEELATLYHFPIKVSGMVTPTLGKIESKRVGPPANLPIEE